MSSQHKKSSPSTYDDIRATLWDLISWVNDLESIGPSQKSNDMACVDAIHTFNQRLTEAKARLQADLIGQQIRNWLSGYPNLEIPEDEIIKGLVSTHDPDWLDLKAVTAYLDKTYKDSAADMALDTLIAQAHPLLPYRDHTAETVRKGAVLHLRCTMDEDYQSQRRTRLWYDVPKQLSALCRLAVILEQNANPATIHEPLGLSLLQKNRDNVVGQWWTIGPLKLRFFCNGRLDVDAGTPDLARKLAKTLYREKTD